MKLTDPERVARDEYAAAVAPVLGMSLAQVKVFMDRELSQLRVHSESLVDKRWYASVEDGSPDYGIYDDAAYMLYLWPGTVLYARPTLKYVVRNVPASEVSHVIDTGCGIGYTTSCLAYAYPDAKVYGTQVEGVQATVGRQLGAAHGFTIVSDVADIRCDPARTLVVSSEYFEHFYDPVIHLSHVVMSIPKPRFMAIANAFGARSAGHFPSYLHEGSEVPNTVIGRRFNSRMREFGYEKTGSGWNGRPVLWARNG